jgi:hypothetical protein
MLSWLCGILSWFSAGLELIALEIVQLAERPKYYSQMLKVKEK